MVSQVFVWYTRNPKSHPEVGVCCGFDKGLISPDVTCIYETLTRNKSNRRRKLQNQMYNIKMLESDQTIFRELGQQEK